MMREFKPGDIVLGHKDCIALCVKDLLEGNIRFVWLNSDCGLSTHDESSFINDPYICNIADAIGLINSMIIKEFQGE